MKESSIIKDTEVLSHSYLPDTLLFRDEEKAQLLNSLSNNVNTFVHGSVGSGKTTLLKSVIEEFNSGNGVKAVYVDATLYQTTNSILQEILSSVSPLGTIPKSNSQLIHRLNAKASRTKMIACIDHFERVKEVSVVDKLLSLGIGLVLVSDDEKYFKRLSRSARSRIANSFQIPKYTQDQVSDILLDRTLSALKQGCYEGSLIEKIAERSKGDAALGISLLKACVTKAESDNRKSITESDIPGSVVNNPKLTDDEQMIFEILEEKRRLPASKLYRLYSEAAKFPKGRRAFREYMRKLKTMGLVRAIGEKRWRIYEFCGE
jgi:Cdc6-like AAA superfamily ATPase